VYVDAADLATNNTEALVDEVVVTLGLSRSDVAFVADKTVQESAAALVARVSAARPKRGS